MAHPIFVLLRGDSARAIQLSAGCDGWNGGSLHNDALTNTLHEHHP
jgi:hypothetical protein